MKQKPVKSHKDLKLDKVEKPLKLKGEKKDSKGKIFKKQHGFSKTMLRNLKKNSLNPFKPVETNLSESECILEYRKIRKARKRKATIERQKKHATSVAYKKANGKTRVKGQKNKKASETKEVKGQKKAA